MFYGEANLAVVLFRVLEHVGWLHSKAGATETGRFQLKTYRLAARKSKLTHVTSLDKIISCAVVQLD